MVHATMWPKVSVSLIKRGQGKVRVASCKLRVASCELQVASCELRVASCELQKLTLYHN